MARPRCSRKDPKRLRSRGAIVLLLSMRTRAEAESGADLVCANAARGRDPIIIPVEPATTAPEACFRKVRLEREKRFMGELQLESNLTGRASIKQMRQRRSSVRTRPSASGIAERR